MTRTPHRWVAVAVALAMTTAGLADAEAKRKRRKKGKKNAAVTAAAGAACGDIALTRGEVRTGRALAPVEKLEGADLACAKEVAGALVELAALRTVTIVVRLPDAQRVGGRAVRVAEAYKELVVAAGVRESRVSVVAPSAGHGQEGQVIVTFTEKKSKRPVAVLESASGPVDAGARRTSLKPTRRGETYTPATYVATKAKSSAAVGLADGSRLKLGSDSLVLLGKMHLNDELKRVVKLELVAGKVEADVRSAGEGSVFDVATRSGVAGVRGTAFRIALDGDEGMRLETLDGVVEVTPKDATQEPILVKKGEGLAVDKAGKAERRALLAPPQAEAPLEGELEPDEALTWKGVDGAKGYLVEVARDAEFRYDVRPTEATGTSLEVATELEAGKWFWRVAATDDAGFVGQTSKVYAFVVDR